MILILVVFGMVIIYSANSQDTAKSSEFNRQLLYFGVGVIFMVIFTVIDYRFLAGIELYLYIFNVLVLTSVLVFGKEALGAQRWIAIGSFTFQPSEFAKIFVIISMAVRLSDEKALQFEKLLGTFVYLAVPMILIMKQPDLGTSLVLLAIFFVMLFVRGLHPAYILAMIALGLGISPFVLKPYQMKRLLVFVNPDLDPTGAGWNLRQSIIGIGSGKMWGKGLFLGTLTNLKYVPEHSRDFIFTVLGEELGFMGGLALIVLYFLLLFKIVRISQEARDQVGSLIAVGVATMFFFHIFVNIGMTIGIMPVTGIPLPFLSYGGSSLICNMMGVGLLLSISMRREQFFK